MHAVAVTPSVNFVSPPVIATPESGGIVLRSGLAPTEPFLSLHEMLERAAELVPHNIFLQERSVFDRNLWNRVTYIEALQLVDQYGRALLNYGLTPDRPLAIISPNSINHALLALAAMSVGIPVAPISVAYSQMADLERVENIFRLLTPGMVFAETWAGFERALSAAAKAGANILVGNSTGVDQPVLTLEKIRDPGQAVGSIRARFPVGPDTIAKVLFTSGSTGSSKGALVTQRMMCSNQEALTQCWPFLEAEPPVAVDWLPWSHVFGGCLIFNCVLRHLGTMVIDDGRPVGSQFERTLQNIRELPPSIYLSVPKALDELVAALRKDDELCRRFFSRLRLIFSAGAGLPKSTWEALHELAGRWSPHEMRIVISYGSTETAPVVCVSSGQSKRPDNIGVPIPGAEMKLAPSEDKFEIRLRGPMVTPGYWRHPELAKDIFDEDGYYKMGDAGKLEDPSRPELGIVFDGRVAEDFKLVTGTWVRTTNVRIACVSALAPLIQDAVVTGQDRDEVGLLAFPSLNGCRQLTKLPGASLAELIDHPIIREAVAQALARLNQGAGSSGRIGRVLLMLTPPSIDTGEITDKGYINQRAVLRARANEVERLYSPTDAGVILPAA
ncbi:feruloyl-CoA synthase [Herbaspirillum lusitanum]|uniref:feruloyl-CoA synthase n=1 Tax=Herbaspirillum lusitanum TaxID=213312 RepID=UPI00030F2FAB|nr:feruloyl-CoA synthase [Herbaspirillum lusitanum]